MSRALKSVLGLGAIGIIGYAIKEILEESGSNIGEDMKTWFDSATGTRKSKIKSGEKLLELAISREDVDGMELFLKRGVDPDSFGEDGVRLIFKAYETGNDEVLLAMIDGGAKLWFLDNNRDTLLHLAARDERVDTANYLIAGGIDLNHENVDGETALYIAYENENYEIVNMITDAMDKKELEEEEAEQKKSGLDDNEYEKAKDFFLKSASID